MLGVGFAGVIRALSPQARLLSVRCASTSSIPRPTRRPTTTRCAARWAAAGAEVELFTSRFAYGPVAPAEGYRAARAVLPRGALRRPAPRAQRAVKLAEHVPDMLRYRRAARAADVVHFQWLPVQHLDGHLLPAAAASGGRRRSCSPRTTSSRASPARASSRRSGVCTSASTRSSSTPSTAARA